MRFCKEAFSLYAVDFPMAFYYRAEAAYHLNRTDDAERFAHEAIQLDITGEVPENMFLLALILEDQGDTTSAIKQLDEFLKVSPRGENARQAREALKRLKS